MVRNFQCHSEGPGTVILPDVHTEFAYRCIPDVTTLERGDMRSHSSIQAFCGIIAAHIPPIQGRGIHAGQTHQHRTGAI